MSYMDDVSDSSSSYLRDKEDQLDAYSQENRNSFRGTPNIIRFLKVVQWAGFRVRQRFRVLLRPLRVQEQRDHAQG